MASWLSSPSPTFRSRPVLFAFSFLLVLLFFVYTPLPENIGDHRNAVLDKAKEVVTGQDQWRPAELDRVESKRAFATFLAGDANAKDDDPYFLAVRLLAYQLLHAEQTRSKDETIPFIVLVTDKVSEKKRQRLQKDGAIVIVGQSIESDWAKTDVSTWQDVMTKLRLWELTQFDRIALLDGDTVLTQPIDSVFDDPAVTMRPTGTKEAAIKADEGALPGNYSFAGVPETQREHGFPPVEEHHDFPNINYLNAGFFVFQPSLEILDYYLSLLKLPGRFNPALPEQNLLNYAHRRDGNMPWIQLGNTWNIHYPYLADLEGGVKSLHDKWWKPEHDEMKLYLEGWRWQMKGYFEAYDRLMKDEYKAHGLDD